jgi:CheY-like chemotaxis protein
MDVNVRVLLVDDNPTVLAMLQKALTSPVASITTVGDAADALLLIVDEPFDLIVTDFQMPGMDGRQLLQKVKARPATARIPVVVLASKADIAEKLRGTLRDLAEEFIEKPFFIRDASRRIKRIVDKIALEKMSQQVPEADGVLRGTLAQMNVIDLLQSLELGRKSCLLTFTKAADRCDLYFLDGQIQHASYGSLKGDPAVFKVVGWSEGNFQIDFKGQSPEQTTTLSTQALLMEGLRMLDEANRDAGESALEAAGLASEDHENADRNDDGFPGGTEADNILET